MGETRGEGEVSLMRHAPNRGVRGKNVGKFFSIKMGRMLWFESLLEEALMYLLDFDSEVK